MDLEMISTMKVEELKDFLRFRGLKVTGKKNELTARVFVATTISGNSKYYVLKGQCRPSQRISDIPHKLWVCIVKQSGKIVSSHCICMAGMAQTCNHVATALFRLEASCRLGLTNPSCTLKACEWLPSNRKVTPIKITDMKLSRNDFEKRGKAKGDLNPSPKKQYDPLSECNFKLCLDDIATTA